MSDSNNHWRPVLMLTGLGGAAVVLVGAGAIMADPSAWKVVALVLAVTAGLGGVLAGCVAVGGASAACPVCRRWWARISCETRTVEQKRCYGIITRQAHTQSANPIQGTSTDVSTGESTSHGGVVFSYGTTSYEERVPVIQTTYELRYQCSHCGDCWTETKVEEVEDFHER